jgi:hypothetical protein
MGWRDVLRLFRRGRAHENPAPSQIPRATGAWRDLPAVQRSAGPPALVTAPDRFGSGLAAWQNPSLSTGGLGHLVAPDGPAGVARGVAETAPPVPPPAPRSRWWPRAGGQQVARTVAPVAEFDVPQVGREVAVQARWAGATSVGPSEAPAPTSEESGGPGASVGPDASRVSGGLDGLDPPPGGHPASTGGGVVRAQRRVTATEKAAEPVGRGLDRAGAVGLPVLRLPVARHAKDGPMADPSPGEPAAVEPAPVAADQPVIAEADVAPVPPPAAPRRLGLGVPIPPGSPAPTGGTRHPEGGTSSVVQRTSALPPGFAPPPVRPVAEAPSAGPPPVPTQASVPPETPTTSPETAMAPQGEAAEKYERAAPEPNGSAEPERVRPILAEEPKPGAGLPPVSTGQAATTRQPRAGSGASPPLDLPLPAVQRATPSSGPSDKAGTDRSTGSAAPRGAPTVPPQVSRVVPGTPADDRPPLPGPAAVPDVVVREPERVRPLVVAIPGPTVTRLSAPIGQLPAVRRTQSGPSTPGWFPPPRQAVAPSWTTRAPEPDPVTAQRASVAGIPVVAPMPELLSPAGERPRAGVAPSWRGSAASTGEPSTVAVMAQRVSTRESGGLARGRATVAHSQQVLRPQPDQGRPAMPLVQRLPVEPATNGRTLDAGMSTESRDAAGTVLVLPTAAVQREVEGAPPPAPEPAAEVPPPGAPTAAPAGPGAAAGPSTPAEVDALVRRLYDPLVRRLKAELRLDRERAGNVLDLRH